MARAPVEGLCDYRMFNARFEGEVPCLAIGSDILDEVNANNASEITGLQFQKVNEGVVKAALRSNIFMSVDWPNAPTRNTQGPNLVIEERDFAPPNLWHQVTNLLLHLKQALLDKMTPQNGPPPMSLHDGFLSDVWTGGTNNCRSDTPFPMQLESIKQAIQQHWISEMWVEEFVDFIVSGLSIRRISVKYFLTNLLGIYEHGRRYIMEAPAKISKNKSLREGVLHCLMYGFHPDQIARAQDLGHYVRRGRLTHRIVLPKVEGDRERSRSRSRSPSPTNDIKTDVRNRNNQSQPLSNHDVFLNPENYDLDVMKLHSYFEPHKPDFVVIQEENNYAKSLCTVEISSCTRFGETSFRRSLNQTTHQCVQQCLAGLSSNQEQIHGLVVVPDGFKLVLVGRHQALVERGPNQVYTVKETELIMWDDTNLILQLLCYLQNSFMN